MTLNTPLRILLLLTLAAGPSVHTLAQDESPAGQTIFRAGSQATFEGPAEYFTGDVRVETVFPPNDTAHYAGAYVTFQPGARTAWHDHPAGQHMIITSGVGLTGTRDGKVIELRAGDTVWCPPNIDHWHGATPDAPMTHFVITGSRDGKNVIWKEKVSDAEYHGSRQQQEKTQVNSDALTTKQRNMIPIAAFTATGDLESLKVAIEAGLNDGLSVNEIKEIQIHLYAYVGFPRALNGLGTLMAVVDERKARGVDDRVGPEASPLPAGKSSIELGREVQTQLAGRPVSGPLFDFAPAVNDLLQSHLFGDLFARDILDYQSREIATVSALASMEGVTPQLNAHIGMAVNAGLTAAQIRVLPAVLRDTVGEMAGRRAEQAVRAVLPEKSGSTARDS